MLTQEKIILSNRNVAQFLKENFDAANFESTMSLEEKNRLACEATDLMGVDDDKAMEIMDRIPLEPAVALRNLVCPGMGREFLKKGGFNLADVEKAFGKDWLERFETDYEQLDRNYVQQG